VPLPRSRADIRIQQVARLRICGRLQDKQIAEMVGMSPAGLRYLMSTPAYVELENSLLEGHVGQMDLELAGNVEEIRNHMRHAVPVAQRTLLELVLQRRDLRTALVASKEILDRDPDKCLLSSKNNSQQGGTAPTVGTFNPQNAGELLQGMTVEATRVTQQLKATFHNATNNPNQNGLTNTNPNGNNNNNDPHNNNEEPFYAVDDINVVLSGNPPSFLADEVTTKQPPHNQPPPPQMQQTQTKVPPQIVEQLQLFDVEAGRF